MSVCWPFHRVLPAALPVDNSGGAVVLLVPGLAVLVLKVVAPVALEPGALLPELELEPRLELP